MIDNDEIDQLAIKYIKLKENAKNGSEKNIKDFKKFQNECIKKLTPLVTKKTSKYKKFSNYKDLEQDGFEALLMALNTYKPEKGSFGFWASQYIKTRVSRSANAHSTIKIPIKKAKLLKPYKTTSIPIMFDGKPTPIESFQTNENSFILKEAVNKLPTDQRKVIKMTYGLNGVQPNTAINIMEYLSISRQEYNKLLTKAKKNLKRDLRDLK